MQPFPGLSLLAFLLGLPMFLSGSGGAVFFGYLWSMLDVQPVASDVPDSIAASDVARPNKRHFETRRSTARRHKVTDSVDSEEGSWSQDDDHGEAFNGEAFYLHVLYPHTPAEELGIDFYHHVRIALPHHWYCCVA